MHTANTHIYVSSELREKVSPKVGREKARLNATCTSFKEAYKEAITMGPNSGYAFTAGGDV